MPRLIRMVPELVRLCSRMGTNPTLTLELTPGTLTVNIGDVTWNDDPNDPLVAITCHTSYNPVFHAVGGCIVGTGEVTDFDKAAGTGSGAENISVIDINAGDQVGSDVTFYLDLDDGGAPVSTQKIIRLGPDFHPKADWDATFSEDVIVFEDGVDWYGLLPSTGLGAIPTLALKIAVGGEVTGTITSSNPTDHISVIAWDRNLPNVETVLAGPATGTLTLTNQALSTDQWLLLRVVPDDVENPVGVVKISGTTVA
jgi:hypothetical protein